LFLFVGFACHLLHAGFLPAYSLTLKMEATYSSEMSADFQQTTPLYIPQDITLFISLVVFGEMALKQFPLRVRILTLKHANIQGSEYLYCMGVSFLPLLCPPLLLWAHFLKREKKVCTNSFTVCLEWNFLLI
jgi:hypothetical protein